MSAAALCADAAFCAGSIVDGAIAAASTIDAASFLIPVALSAVPRIADGPSAPTQHHE
jgi:hypothetical protein